MPGAGLRSCRGGASAAWASASPCRVDCCWSCLPPGGAAHGGRRRYSPPQSARSHGTCGARATHTVATTTAPAGPRRWFLVLLACYSLEGVGYIIAGTFLVAAIGQTSPGWLGNGAWLLVGLAAAPSAALWAMASARWSRPALLVVALLVQAGGIALPALIGGVGPALIGAVSFGGTFIGVSTIALAAGRELAFPGAVAVLTAGYSVGQIVGPLMVTPLVAPRLSLRAAGLRRGGGGVGGHRGVVARRLPETQPAPARCGSSCGSHTPGSLRSDVSTPAVKASTTACTCGFGSSRRHTSDHVHIGIGRCTGRRRQVRRSRVVLTLGVVQDRTPQPPDVVEEGRARHSPVVHACHLRPRRGGELLGEPVPRRPARLIGIHQHRQVARVDG